MQVTTYNKLCQVATSVWCTADIAFDADRTFYISGIHCRIVVIWYVACENIIIIVPLPYEHSVFHPSGTCFLLVTDNYLLNIQWNKVVVKSELTLGHPRDSLSLTPLHSCTRPDKHSPIRRPPEMDRTSCRIRPGLCRPKQPGQQNNFWVMNTKHFRLSQTIHFISSNVISGQGKTGKSKITLRRNEK